MAMGAVSRGVFVCVLLSVPQPLRGEEPQDILKGAIKAHGGEDKIAASLTGKLVADATFDFPGAGEGKITWEESFELPRRYRRLINGKFQDQPVRMEYAITKGAGWIKQGDGPARDFKGEALPLSRSWNAMLATLPWFLGADVKLSPGGKVKVGEEEAVSIKVSSKEDGDSTLYFSAKTGLLLKAKRVMQNPLTGMEADGEVVFGDYKEVSGVQYPHRVTSYVGGKKVMELQIKKIEFLKTLDDRLFDKP
jgi:hypothetical protein